jgi:hypothetical protein
MDYIIFLFLGWGITSTVVNGSIFDKLRNYFIVKFPFYSKLLYCVRCLGFWVGAFIFTPLVQLEILDPIFSNSVPYWISILAMPVLQSNFGVIVESFLVFLVKGTKNNIQ